jgi:hypothetical protein
MEAEPGQRLDELVLLGQPIDHRLQAGVARSPSFRLGSQPSPLRPVRASIRGLYAPI